MKINVTLEEYLKNPLSNEDIKIMASRFKFGAHFLFIFGLSSSFLLAALSYSILEKIEIAFLIIILSAIPMLALSAMLTDYIFKVTKTECEFIIDKELLMGGSAESSMNYIKESFVDLKSQFKSPKAMKLIKAIEHTNRQPVKAELEMLNILERKFKEELYNKA